MTFRCRRKYRLELRWDSVEYDSKFVARLHGARFEGPALKNAAKIEAPDSIRLDLTPQMVSLLASYYTVPLTWEGVEYVGEKVYLKNAALVNEGIQDFHKIDSADYIVINTEKHEEAVHAYNLLYEAQVVRSDGKPYKYDDA